MLPSKALPTTSKITTISNSKDRFIRIYYVTGLQADIPLIVDAQTTDEQVSKKVLDNIHDVNAVVRYAVHFPIPDFPRIANWLIPLVLIAAKMRICENPKTVLRESGFHSLCSKWCAAFTGDRCRVFEEVEERSVLVCCYK